MSLVSAGATPTIPGTVQLFAGVEPPAGWSRLREARVDPAVFSTLSSRIMLMPYGQGDSSITSTNLFSASWLADPASNEHVYVLSGTALRHHHVLTGQGTACASAGVSLVNATMTASGIFATSSTSPALWFYDFTSDAWTRVTSLTASGSHAFVPVADPARNRLLLLWPQELGTAAGSNFSYDIASRLLTPLPALTHGFGASCAVAVGDQLLTAARVGTGTLTVCTLDLQTLTVAEYAAAPSPLAFASLGSSQALALTSTATFLLELNTEGVLVSRPLPLAGFAARVERFLPRNSNDTRTVAGNNVFICYPAANNTYVPALLSIAELDAEIPHSSIFYARKR